MTESTASTAPTASTALAAVTAALPEAEERPGQQRMATLVQEAIDSGRHLVVQAGTGTGKTLAYLVPAISSGSRVVVATATKALQDQLAGKDLPFLAKVASGRVRLVRAQRAQQLRVPATAP